MVVLGGTPTNRAYLLALSSGNLGAQHSGVAPRVEVPPTPLILYVVVANIVTIIEEQNMLG